MSRADHHGPTARERAVLELAEARVPNDEIARLLELTPRYVYQVVQALLAPKLHDWQSPARRASAELLNALRSHHPERCARPTNQNLSPSYPIPGSAGAAMPSASGCRRWGLHARYFRPQRTVLQ